MADEDSSIIILDDSVNSEVYAPHLTSNKPLGEIITLTEDLEDANSAHHTNLESSAPLLLPTMEGKLVEKRLNEVSTTEGGHGLQESSDSSSTVEGMHIRRLRNPRQARMCYDKKNESVSSTKKSTPIATTRRKNKKSLSSTMDGIVDKLNQSSNIINDILIKTKIKKFKIEVEDMPIVIGPAIKSRSKVPIFDTSVIFLDDTLKEKENDCVMVLSDEHSSSTKGDILDKKICIKVSKEMDKEKLNSENNFKSFEDEADCVVVDSTNNAEHKTDGNIFGTISLDIEGDDVVIVGETEHNHATIVDEVTVPSYESDYLGFLTVPEFSMETGKIVNNAPGPSRTCFNCLGNHNISDCVEQHNYKNIAQNRKKYMANRGAANIRYHENVDNKYNHFQPGIISESLNEALGLRRRELPDFIYRMRVLGYPPGWLKEAEVHQADVILYDGEGKSVAHPHAEDGETEPTVKYNPDKLVSFPGFNVPIPKHMRDDWRDLNYPPMQKLHRKEEFEKFMLRNKAEKYKKKKLKSITSNSDESILTTKVDMEVDESGLDRSSKLVFNPPLPLDQPPPPPPEVCPPKPLKVLKPLEEGEISSDSDEDTAENLEKQRNIILQELKKEETAVIPEKDNTDIIKLPEVEDTNKLIESKNNTISDSETEANNNSTATHHHHSRSLSKGFSLGVVIPQTSEVNAMLPEEDKWAKDISDHILFENLPDALGTWNKMRGLMSVVKDKMNEIHKEDDD